MPHEVSAAPCDPSQIPASLTTATRWVNFKTRPKSNGKLDKVLLNPATLHNAKVNDETTWGTFPAALANLGQPRVAGIGRTVTPDEGIVFLDWDDCINVDGHLDPIVAAEVAAFQTYTEVSPSGHGLRAVVFGTLPAHGRNNHQAHRECYNSGRFVTFTGRHLHGTPTTVEPRQAELDVWHARWWPKASTPAVPLAPAPVTALEDQAILTIVRGAKNGDRFAALFDTVPPADDKRASEDDLALANILAFYATDAAQLRRLLEGSARRRAKWDSPRGTSTWLDTYVVDVALRDRTATYRGGQTWDGPSLTPEALAAAGADADTPSAIMAELARWRALAESEHSKRIQAEATVSNLLRALANPHLRNEVRLIAAEAMNYQKALRRGSVDEQGYSWLYIGSKDETGLAGEAQMSPRTISRQLKKHDGYEIAGQPLIDLVEDEVEGSDGNRRTRYRYKVPFIEQGGTLGALLGQVAAYEPPGVAEGTRQTAGGYRPKVAGHCDDCGGPLEEVVRVSKRIQTVEQSTITCLGCGQVHPEPERITKSDTHLVRDRRYRLDLPDLPRQPAAENSSPAIMAELPLDRDDPSSPVIVATLPGDAPAVSFVAAAVDVDRATPCPVAETEPSSAIMADGQRLPPGFTHWCPGDHQFPVPLTAKVERCSGCTRPWRGVDATEVQ